MKRTLYLISMLLLSNQAGAVKISVGTGNPPASTCAARLGSEPMQETLDVTRQPQFCSGTLIDAQTLVTSNHCLNDVVSDIGNIDNVSKSRSFNLAFGRERGSIAVPIMQGPNAIASIRELNSSRQREQYISAPNMSYTHGDFAVVRLAHPISGFSGSNCPRLPTTRDCQQLTEALKNSSTLASQLWIDAFISNEVSIGAGASRQLYPYPSNLMTTVRAISIGLNTQGYFFVRFPQQNVLKKGDSGTNLIWENNGEKIILGTLSGVTANGGGAFSNLCRNVESPRWAAVVTSRTQTATASPAPVPSAGVGTPGAR